MLKHSRDVALLAALVYFTQGALGISGITLPLYLRKLNWTVTEITTVSSLAAIPWVLKIFYGLLSDSWPLFGYRRKSYLVLFALTSALGWCSLVFLPVQKHWILLSLLTTNLGFAATDVITDGLIVEHSTALTSSIYQAIAWGSRSLGAFITGLLGGWLAANWQARDVFLLTMLLPLPLIPVILWMRERKMERAPFQSALTPARRCLHLLLMPNLRLFVGILIVASIAASFGIPFFFFMKETLGFHETFLGLLTSTGWVGAMIGSLIYVRWLRRVSPKVTLFWALAINSLNIFSTLLIFDQRSAFVLIFIGGVMGCLTMLPIMSWAATLTHHSGVEGTLFAILMSLFNLGQIAFGYLGGKLVPAIGLYPLILATGCIALSGLFFVRQLAVEPPAAAAKPWI